jgi:hypothetical protein
MKRPETMHLAHKAGCPERTDEDINWLLSKWIGNEPDKPRPTMGASCTCGAFSVTRPTQAELEQVWRNKLYQLATNMPNSAGDVSTGDIKAISEGILALREPSCIGNCGSYQAGELLTVEDKIGPRIAAMETAIDQLIKRLG